MDKFDLPEKPQPETDADLYEGEQLPDTTSVQEFTGQDAVWSEDISEYCERKKTKYGDKG